MSTSLRAFANDYVEEVDWDFLTDEFRTAKDPRLADVARLFSEPDTIENRGVILLHIWKRIRELAEYKPKGLPTHIWPFLAETATTPGVIKQLRSPSLVDMAEDWTG